MKMSARIGVFLLYALVSSVQAAQLAKVDRDGVEFYDTPRPGARVIGIIHQGLTFAVSNLPVEGFYRARMPDGFVGWLKSESVVLVKREVDNDPLIGKGEGKLEPPTFQEVSIRGLGGVSMFSMSDVSTALGIASIPAASYFAGELHFGLSPTFAFIARLEYLWKSALATDPLSTTSYTLSFSGLPIHVGLQWNFATGDFTAGFKLLGGVTLSSQMLFGTTQFQKALAFGGLGALSAEYRLSDAFFIAAELGYRYASTGTLVASVAGNSSLGTSSLSLNWSGMVFGGGAGVRF